MKKSKPVTLLSVDKKGRINLTDDQWKFFCEYLRCQSFSLKYQRQMIKACINGLLESALKDKNAVES